MTLSTILAVRLIRPSRWAGFALAPIALLALATLPAEVSAQDVIRVEEDWVLKVGTPSAKLATPQVTCTMSPLCHADELHFVFDLNHQTAPVFTAGGMQVNVWNHDDLLESRKFPRDEIMNTSWEVISWTQVLSLANGNVQFEIVAGNSTSWGKFGGQGYLQISEPTELTNLNDYSKACSIKNSGISFARDFAGKMGMIQVRKYGTKGLVEQDTEFHLFR